MWEGNAVHYIGTMDPEKKPVGNVASEKEAEKAPAGPPSAGTQAEEPPSPALLPLSIRIGIAKDILQMLAIVAAGIWAIYTFQQQIEEAARREKPAWSPKLTLKRIGKRGNEVAIRATLFLENKGTARQNFWAASLNVFGWRLQGMDGGVAKPLAIPETNSEWAQLRGFAEQGKHLLASFGRTVVPPTNAFVDPGANHESHYIFYVDKNQVDFVEARFTLLVPNELEEARDAGMFKQYRNGHGEVLLDENCERLKSSKDCHSYTTTEVVQMSLWDDGEVETSSEKH